MRNVIKGMPVVLFSLIMLAACEKDNAGLLTRGTWTFESMTTDSEQSNIISVVSLAQALLTGATLEFQDGGTYILDSPLVDDPTTGEWELIGEEQLILSPDDGAGSTSRIDILTKDKLAYVESLMDTEMHSYSITTTWSR